MKKIAAFLGILLLASLACSTATPAPDPDAKATISALQTENADLLTTVATLQATSEPTKTATPFPTPTPTESVSLDGVTFGKPREIGKDGTGLNHSSYAEWNDDGLTILYTSMQKLTVGMNETDEPVPLKPDHAFDTCTVNNDSVTNGFFKPCYVYEAPADAAYFRVLGLVNPDDFASRCTGDLWCAYSRYDDPATPVATATQTGTYQTCKINNGDVDYSYTVIVSGDDFKVKTKKCDGASALFVAQNGDNLGITVSLPDIGRKSALINLSGTIVTDNKATMSCNVQDVDGSDFQTFSTADMIWNGSSGASIEWSVAKGTQFSTGIAECTIGTTNVQIKFGLN